MLLLREHPMTNPNARRCSSSRPPAATSSKPASCCSDNLLQPPSLSCDQQQFPGEHQQRERAPVSGGFHCLRCRLSSSVFRRSAAPAIPPPACATKQQHLHRLSCCRVWFLGSCDHREEERTSSSGCPPVLGKSPPFLIFSRVLDLHRNRIITPCCCPSFDSRLLRFYSCFRFALYISGELFLIFPATTTATGHRGHGGSRCRVSMLSLVPVVG